MLQYLVTILQSGWELSLQLFFPIQNGFEGGVVEGRLSS